MLTKEGAEVTIQDATISDNQGGASAGGLYIASGATVECENTTFSGNKGLNGTTYSNGGAVYCAGTFTDKNSSYTGNKAKQGGAIIVMGGSVTLTGTDTTKALIKDNQGASNGNGGGAIYLNKGTLEVTGYIFEGNTSEGTTDSAIYIVANRTATLSNVTFQGSTTQKIYVCKGGALIKSNVTGATIADENASETNLLMTLFTTLSKSLLG